MPVKVWRSPVLALAALVPMSFFKKNQLSLFFLYFFLFTFLYCHDSNRSPSSIKMLGLLEPQGKGSELWETSSTVTQSAIWPEEQRQNTAIKPLSFSVM